MGRGSSGALGWGMRRARRKAAHLSPTGWGAIEEVMGIGGHCAEVETTDLQELLLLWV